MRQFGDVPCKSHGFHTARAELDPATMRQHHVAAVSAGSDLHPHVQPFAIRNEPLHSSQAAPSTAALHAVWPLTIQAQGEQVLLPPVCTPVIAEKRPNSSPEIPSFAGCSGGQLIDFGEEQLENRRSVCLAVTYGQIDRWCFTLQRTGEGHLSALLAC